ncbi:MAG: hypothetical protein DRO98_04655 [Archaeoglobales archaeon]|nr:MAG: hypothetical protein DRO98_04655 [Archaeoglobales archaeon]
MKAALIILIALVVLGCLAESPKLAETPAMAPSQTQLISKFQFGVKHPARVIYVYDGDTIKVNLSGQILIVRLLGIDTPERYPEKNKPYEYDAITNLTYLAEWGSKAKDFACAMLYNRTVYIEFDEIAGLKDGYGRYLAYVYVNGTDFNALLVKNGYARVYVEGKFKKENYYLQLEKIAKAKKVGLWKTVTQEMEDVEVLRGVLMNEDVGKFIGSVNDSLIFKIIRQKTAKYINVRPLHRPDDVIRVFVLKEQSIKPLSRISVRVNVSYQEIDETEAETYGVSLPYENSVYLMSFLKGEPAYAYGIGWEGKPVVEVEGFEVYKGAIRKVSISESQQIPFIFVESAWIVKKR